MPMFEKINLFFLYASILEEISNSIYSSNGDSDMTLFASPWRVSYAVKMNYFQILPMLIAFIDQAVKLEL